MPLDSFCCALNCSNGPLVRPSKDPSLHTISRHRFPVDPSVHEQWVKAIGKGNYIAKKHNFLCSEHFVEDDFHSSNNNLPYQRYPLLNKTAVPSIFNEYKPREGKIILFRKRTENILQVNRKETCATEEPATEVQFMTSPDECNILIQEESSKIIKDKINVKLKPSIPESLKATTKTPTAASSSLKKQRKQFGKISLESIVTLQNGHDYCVQYINPSKRKRSSKMVYDSTFDQSTSQISSDSAVITGEIKQPSLLKKQPVSQGGSVNQHNCNTGIGTIPLQENQLIIANNNKEVIPCDDAVPGGHDYNIYSTSCRTKPPLKNSNDSVQADHHYLNRKDTSAVVNNANTPAAAIEKVYGSTFDQSTSQISSYSAVITGEIKQPSLLKKQPVSQGGSVNQHNCNTGIGTNPLQENQLILANNNEVIPCKDAVQWGHDYKRYSTSCRTKPPLKIINDSVQADHHYLNRKDTSAVVNHANTPAAAIEKVYGSTFDQSTSQISSYSAVITGEIKQPSLLKKQPVSQGGSVNQHNCNTGIGTNPLQENQLILANNNKEVIPCKDAVQWGHDYKRYSTSCRTKPPLKIINDSVQADHHYLNRKDTSAVVNHANTPAAAIEKPESCPYPQSTPIQSSLLKASIKKSSPQRKATEQNSNNDCIKCKKLIFKHSVKEESYKRMKKLMKGKVDALEKRLKRREATLEKLKNKIKMVNGKMPKVFEEKIKESFSGIPLALILTQIINKGRCKASPLYCQEVKEFAINLYSTSVKSYEYMTSVGFNLPRSSTVRNWKIKLKRQEDMVNETANELVELVQFKNKAINNADLLLHSVIDEENADVT